MNKIVGYAVRNALESVLLVVGMLLLCGTLGWLFWGITGLVCLSTLTASALFVSTRISPQLVLRVYGGLPLREEEAPQLVRMLQKLAEKAELPRTPQMFFIPTWAPNAFSVGSRENGIIAITEGLAREFTPRELRGVLAHEVGHLIRNDGLVMSLAVSVTRLVDIMSWIGKILLFIHIPLFVLGVSRIPWLLIVILVFAPLTSALLQLALSRTREFEADYEAVKLTGDPRGLALGLEKFESLTSNWFERLFLGERWTAEFSLLRSHPPTEDRIRRLLEMERDLVTKELA
jgi:heat shock protein HtpX